MATCFQTRTTCGLEATRCSATKRKSTEIGTSEQAPSRLRTDADKPSMPHSEGGSGGIKSPTESGRKILSTNGPEEVVPYRRISRDDFPARWPRNSLFEHEKDFNEYIAKFIGEEFPMTEKKNEAAVNAGFRDRVHELAMRLLDDS